MVQNTTLFESNRIKVSLSSSFQWMNALVWVRSRLFSSSYLLCVYMCVCVCVCTDLRDVASANSTPTIDFPFEVQSRETGFSFDYTFRGRPELGSWAGSEKFTSPRSRNRRCDFAFAFDVRLPTPGMIESSGSIRNVEPGWIFEVYGDERSSCRGKCSYICWDVTERSLSRSSTRLSPLSVGLLIVESTLVLDIR